MVYPQVKQLVKLATRRWLQFMFLLEMKFFKVIHVTAKFMCLSEMNGARPAMNTWLWRAVIRGEGSPKEPDNNGCPRLHKCSITAQIIHRCSPNHRHRMETQPSVDKTLAKVIIERKIHLTENDGTWENMIG